MVSLLITLLVAILIVAVLFYAVDLLGMDGRLSNLLKLVVIVLALVVVLQRSGVV
jgi:hypothetical protein